MATTLQPEAAAKVNQELSAILHRAAVASLDDVGWIRVTGSDRVRWLNGMVTNSIATLAPGHGCYNFVLNAQGRIVGDLTAFALEDSILLEASRHQIPTLLAHFDHFIIMDDVELADISDQRSGILIVGPDSLSTIQQLGGAPCSTPAPPAPSPSTIRLKQTDYRGAAVDLIEAYSPLILRFEIWSSSQTIDLILTELACVPKGSSTALEALRILEGTPRYNTDIRNTESAKDLPQETAQTHALHFAKGCYLGQEIVERIRSRGNVHRTFTGFQLTGSLPAAGTPLQSEGKPVGELTSVSAIDLLSGPIQLALGYIRREALQRNLPLEYPGGTATPATLPFNLESITSNPSSEQ
ncbi:MAG TPA: folate-binding protein [Acidobacteriaceae bacterium]|nr:folate-binding protein [Acidobacteriaceae bacterium]